MRFLLVKHVHLNADLRVLTDRQFIDLAQILLVILVFEGAAREEHQGEALLHDLLEGVLGALSIRHAS